MAIEFEVIYWSGQWQDNMWTLGMWPYTSRTTGDEGYCIEFPNTRLIETSSIIVDLIEINEMDANLIETKSIYIDFIDTSEFNNINLIETINVNGEYCGC